MTPYEQYMLIHYLTYHLERAQQGLLKAQTAANMHPLNPQFQGMELRFGYLVSLIADLMNLTEGKQDWRPSWLKHMQAEGIDPCPPRT